MGTMIPSSTHLVLIPSYNAGKQLYDTVDAARGVWAPVWVVIDGSTDGTAAGMATLAEHDANITVIRLARNLGKGAAILEGLKEADKAGFSHVLTMDSDGQHPTAMIAPFMEASMNAPKSMILGRPTFDRNAPSIRVKGRRISNWWTNLETIGAGIGDSLFGFRVYPIVPLLDIMLTIRWMRRFDFDPEAVVRLAWQGVPPINIDAPVRYLDPGEGGVSHFHYGRDNLLLTWMHTRLMLGLLRRLPDLLRRRAAGAPPFGTRRDRGASS